MSRPNNRSRTRLATAAAGAILGCTPALLQMAMPSGSNTSAKWLHFILQEFSAGPGNTLALALGGVGIAMLFAGAFAERASGYETLLEDQLEFAVTTFLFVSSTLLSIALLTVVSSSVKDAVGMLLLAVIPVSIAIALLNAPKLLRNLYGLHSLSPLTRTLLVVGGAAAMAAAMARLLCGL